LEVAEALAAVLVTTGLVAVLNGVAPVTGLGVIYLLPVVWLAVRRGLVAALLTAVVSVLALNYFFIAPVHRLTIADRENVAALAVFLIVAAVVARLAAAVRARAADADARASLAVRRERETAVVAEAAEALLSGRGAVGPLDAMAGAVARAVGGGARLTLDRTASPQAGERALELGARPSGATLYLSRVDPAWGDEDLGRLREPLARLVEVALERGRLADAAAETEAARRATGAKTAVLHAISHDLRSPLTGITTAAGALRQPGLGRADRTELVELIDEQSARLARMVDALLDLSRIEADAVEPRRDWCDLSDVVAGAAEAVRATRGEFVIEMRLAEDLPLVQADPSQLERVFVNLIENAVKFSPPGEAVRIRGSAGGGRVVVRVIDRGRGIPANQRQQVFEPFFRGRSGDIGTGLGLAICRGFVEANGGQIFLQNAPGEGTSFAVVFPLVAQPVAAL